MLYTLSKHIKFRLEKNKVLLCNCKKLSDYKVPKHYYKFLLKLKHGIEKEKLTIKEKKLFSDLKKARCITTLTFRPITKKEFEKAHVLLEQELFKHVRRTRSKKFLFEKYKKNPFFFIGCFLGKELIGVIQGFPREDYLLISELAVSAKFRNCLLYTSPSPRD